MLKKAYVEITNVCNLSCTFCHGTVREKRFMSPEEFRKAAQRIRPHTQYIYLHLMGEPLLHPELDKILDICTELDFKVTVTTNGTLIGKKKELLLSKPCLYKVSLSLHSFEANEGNINPEEYLHDICLFAKAASSQGVICVFRLWNGHGQNFLNREIKEISYGFFPLPHEENAGGEKLSEKVFLEYGEKFSWPDMRESKKNVRFCMGLRDQIGVLCDGTVVPCCLDSEGEIVLGNIFTDEVSAILSSPRAVSIYNGFSAGEPAEELCRHCGYAERFSR